MLVRVPTREEEDQSNRFRTYLNYLLCLSEFLTNAKSQPEVLIGPVIQANVFRNIQGGRCQDLEKLGRLLRNAWFTEIQMSIASQFEDFVSYSNHWTPVQLYYSAYLALRAYFAASNQDVSREHATNLKVIGEEIQRRPMLFPQPWRTVCTGNPEYNSCVFVNLPEGVLINSISPLSSSRSVPFWDSYAMFLRTTRERQLRQLCEDWKETEGRRRMDPQLKKSFVENMSPTSLFHILYRLRLRSNYADADSFLLSVQGTTEATGFSNALTNIGWASLLVLELLIARYIGKKAYEEIVMNFRQYDRRGWSDELIGLRWRSIKPLW